VIPNDGGLALSRLLAELARCEGEELDLALAESAGLFGCLGAQLAEPFCAGKSAVHTTITLERAQRELSKLIAGELLRLCGLATLQQDASRAHSAQDLAELLHEELDCARSVEDLPAALLARLRRLATRLPLGIDDSPQFQRCAATLRRALQAAHNP
jgi:hypothetical protein